MEKIIFLIIYFNTLYLSIFCQTIPTGQSNDTVFINVDSVSNITSYNVFYYKPPGYDQATSPILWYVHGLGGNGSNIYSLFTNYAERRNALIVGVTMHTNWELCGEGTILYNGCRHFQWYPTAFKQIYQHIKARESRVSIPVYLTGFSAGGQFVTRYMLIRQGVPDSIPIIHAASLSPYNYTFCTDTFQNIDMPYYCGLSKGIGFNPQCQQPYQWVLFDKCNQNIIQYYNENYTVLVGTLDTLNFNPGQFCSDVQGPDRLERARTFYAFSDSNAVNRGTTLKWNYAEIPGIAHDGTALYSYIVPGDTIPLVEKILFETPYHSVPSLAPIASFSADTTIVQLPDGTVNFINTSINGTSYKWLFGDGDSSIVSNPYHTYQYADTFHVSLTAFSPVDCSNKLTKYKYIIVKNPVSASSISFSKYFSIYPNPIKENLTITSSANQPFVVTIYNVNSQLFFQKKFQGNQSIIDMNSYKKGIYFLKIFTDKEIIIKKIIKE